jgi:hypothetical protein
MEIYPNIAEQLNNLDIGVLGMQFAQSLTVLKNLYFPLFTVNNVGLGYEHPMNVQLR